MAFKQTVFSAGNPQLKGDQLIIPSGSTLKNIPSNLDPKQRVQLDGIRSSIEMADLAFRRLVQSLSLISKRAEQDFNSDNYTLAFSDAWTIIDSIDRLRGLLHPLAKSDQNDSNYIQGFIDSFTVIRVLRNGIQHVNGRIEKLVKNNSSVWGSLSWVAIDKNEPNSGKVHVIIDGPIINNSSFPAVNPIEKDISYPISQIQLTAYEESVNISDIHEALRSLYNNMEEMLKPQFEGQPKSGATMHMSLSFTMALETSDSD